jgi:prepilin-type N-terminal cleavage/methylation domain-containing protein
LQLTIEYQKEDKAMLLKMMKKNEGFTLIELMIVIAIIGILAAIAIPQFSAYRVRSFNAAAKADLRNAATAQEAYFADNQTYAGTIDQIRGTTYGFFSSQNVNTDVEDVNTTGYTMTATHTKGNRTYTLAGPGGTITPSN